MEPKVASQRQVGAMARVFALMETACGGLKVGVKKWSHHLVCNPHANGLVRCLADRASRVK